LLETPLRSTFGLAYKKSSFLGRYFYTYIKATIDEINRKISQPGLHMNEKDIVDMNR
jgi:hypothetical protein